MTVVKCYSIGIDQHHRLYQVCGQEVNSMDTPEEEMHEAVLRHCRTYGLDAGDARQYVVGYRAVLEARPDLRVRYAGFSGRSQGEAATPGEEADRRAKAYMREKNEKDYSVALHAVLEADPELRDAYAR